MNCFEIDVEEFWSVYDCCFEGLIEVEGFVGCCVVEVCVDLVEWWVDWKVDVDDGVVGVVWEGCDWCDVWGVIGIVGWCNCWVFFFVEDEKFCLWEVGCFVCVVCGWVDVVVVLDD